MRNLKELTFEIAHSISNFEFSGQNRRPRWSRPFSPLLSFLGVPCILARHCSGGPFSAVRALLGESTQFMCFLQRRTIRQKLSRVWSFSLGFVVLIRSPQQWQSDKLGRSLVFLRSRSEDESDDRAESDDAAAATEPCFGYGLARNRFREDGVLVGSSPLPLRLTSGC